VPIEKIHLDTANREEWKNLDFHALKKSQLQKIDDQITGVKQLQRDHRENVTDRQLEQAEYLQNENIALQKELGKTIDAKRTVLG